MGKEVDPCYSDIYFLPGCPIYARNFLEKNPVLSGTDRCYDGHPQPVSFV